MSQAQDRRKAPNAAERQIILELQGNRCLYCDLLFNSAIERKGRLIFLKVNWDQICNGIKSSYTFKTLEEARVYVMSIRILKGVREDRDGNTAS